jgi:nucleotide-binding universal stress UspA family protein
LRWQAACTPRQVMRLLVATDGSTDSRAAIDWLSHLSLAESAVRVITVVTLPPSAIDIPPVQDYYQALLDDGQAVVRMARDALGASCPALETTVLRGDPREQIVEAAREWKTDLLVMGARGLGSFAGAMLGSVSMAALRWAHCPVLVVKGGTRPLRRAVVAIDGSKDSLAAARFLATLPFRSPIAMRLLAVLESPPALTPGEALRPVVLADPGTLFGERRAELEGILDRVAFDLRPVAKDVERSVAIGRPAKEIVSAANEVGVDLMVVGSRGLGQVGRWLLGSVSERVIHEVQCPVLVVPPPGARRDLS